MAAEGAAGLSTVQMVSPTTVFAGGTGRVIRSDDGGLTWTLQEIRCTRCSGAFEVADLDMLSATDGWAATSLGLFRTTDGVQWFEQPTGQEREPASVDFVSGQDGWIVTAGAVVARTNDAGATWTPVAGVPADVQGLCFPSRDEGWLATRTAAYHSTDGGTTWTLVLQQPYEGTTTVNCAASGEAWLQFTKRGATPSGRAWTVVHLADGGQNSTPVAAGTHPAPIAVIDAFNAFLVEYSPSEESLDGIFFTSIGESGQRNVITQSLVNGSSFIPTAVSFADKGHGVLVGDADRRRPSIYTTADGGATWTSAQSP